VTVRIPLRTRVLTRVHRLRRRVRDVTYGEPDPQGVREDVARRYLRGSGLEIGALHLPLRVPPQVTVRYVDRLRADELRRRYPEYADRWIVDPEVIDDAGTLGSVAGASQDFVIANHVLEHMENPIGALEAWLRVVRPGGVLYLAVPDKRRTFDAERPSTPISHLRRDHEEGPSWSRSQHYEEYARLAERVPEDGVAARAEVLESEHVDIHFHVWTLPELTAFLFSLELPFDAELIQANGNETLLILRRLGSK
jgi:predicted SAM-dependent methyltransferase